MTYNVFGGTLSLTQSINQCTGVVGSVVPRQTLARQMLPVQFMLDISRERVVRVQERSTLLRRLLWAHVRSAMHALSTSLSRRSVLKFYVGLEIRKFSLDVPSTRIFSLPSVPAQSCVSPPSEYSCEVIGVARILSGVHFFPEKKLTTFL